MKTTIPDTHLSDPAVQRATDHTPGPWHWGAFDLTDRLFIAHQDDADPEHTSFLAEMQKYNGNEADARLIAAAPELLEALQALLREFVPSRDRFTSQAQNAALTLAQAAIAKAL